MTEAEITALQAAHRIRDRLQIIAREKMTVHLPTDYWEKILQFSSQMEKATAHGWQRAAWSLRADLARAVDYCRERLAGLFVELDKEPKPIPSLSTLYHEILSLDQEFEEVEIDFEHSELCVTTESIRLKGFFLGPFQIRLDLEKLGNPAPYYVKALDPHPAAANDGVTHPHVQDERLCEGDGRTAIKHALEEGRLGDFFLLVAQVLRTYGKGSAYIELDDWEGVCCSDCGDSVHEEERCYCNRCDVTLCDACARTCAGCDCSYCSDCLELCAECGESYCSTCLTPCQNCHQNVCSNCLTNNLCEKCHAKLQPSNDDNADNECGDGPCDSDAGEATPAEAPLAVGG